ncbi:hypothetical protein H0H87_012035 [Tephrocybe sp. NHM501043]|nr:hypothetical protein H0H87_012035 [Tephrocybe sp. NHM501043]
MQAISPVPPIFFLEVKQHYTSESKGWGEGVAEEEEDQNDNSEVDDDSDEERSKEGGMQQESMAELTFEEAMDAHIDTISEFVKGLEFQVQFHDHHMLKTLERAWLAAKVAVM